MITAKAWGFEDEIVNVEYCGKRMFVNEQHRCSIHKHAVKDEVLMVAGGLLWFETGSTPEKMNGVWMRDNERIRIMPGTWHRFTAVRDTIIMEFSTHHEDSDSIRHVTGGKVGEDEFRGLLVNFFKHENQDRIITPDRAGIIASGLHEDGRRIGMVNGCFDLMHLGHVELLRQARFRCEVLFAAVNSDSAVRSLKGNTRPFVDEVGRTGMVEACRFVDYVVIANEKTCLDVVNAIKPNVYITTTEYNDSGPEGQEVIKLGGTVEVIDKIKGYNTTAISQAVKTAK